MKSDHVEKQSGVQHAPRSRTRHSRARGKGTAHAEDRIQLAAIGRTLSIVDVTTDPCLSQLMSEDACWRFAYEHWLATKPPRWNRQQWQRWQREGVWIAKKRSRIEDLARALGLPPRTAPVLPWHRRALRRLFRR